MAVDRPDAVAPYVDERGTLICQGDKLTGIDPTGSATKTAFTFDALGRFRTRTVGPDGSTISIGGAVRGVTANKLRSALTTLGILIGVASVIMLVAVGTGSSQSVANSIARLGSNTLTVTASSTAGGGFAGTEMIAEPSPP